MVARKPYRLLPSLIGLLLMLSASQARAQSDVYTFDIQNAPLGDILEEVTEAAGLRLLYSSSIVDLRRKTSLQVTEQPLAEVLRELLWTFPLRYELKDGALYIYEKEAPPTGTVVVRVTDSLTGHGIEGATVVAYAYGIGAISGVNGEAVLRQLPKQDVVVRIGMMGYADTGFTVTVVPGSKPVYEVRLQPEPLTFEDVIIVNDPIVEPVGSGHHVVDQRIIQAVQGVNEDPLEAVRMLPGVSEPGNLFFNQGLFVRGGEPVENLTLLDNIRLPWPFFLFGKSIINPEFIEQTEVLTGGFSARYGDHMSSVQNYRTRDGDFQAFRGKLRQTLWNTNLVLETPLIKDKLSILAVGRRSTFDWLWGAERESLPNMADGNLKVTWNPNPNNRISLTSVVATDRVTVTDSLVEPLLAREGIYAQSLQWRSLLSDKLYSKLSILHGLSTIDISGQPQANVQFRNREIGVREDLGYYFDARHHLKTGASLSYEAENGREAGFYESPDHTVGDSSLLIYERPLEGEAWKVGAYAMLEGPVATRVRYLAGLRGDYHSSNGRFVLSPRLSVDYQITDRIKANLTSGVYHQSAPTHIHRSFPDLRPQHAWHHIFGLHSHFSMRTSLHIEGYLKQYRNQVIFDSLQQFSNDGTGHAYGIETSLERRTAFFHGRVSYTYARVNRQRPLQFRQHPAFYERPHTLKGLLVLRFEPGRWFKPVEWEMDFRLTSGRLQTPAVGVQNASGFSAILWGNINSERLSAYHLLNTRLTWRRRIGRQKRHAFGWTIAIWNLYGRSNQLGTAYQINPDTPQELISTPLRAFPFFLDLGIELQFNKKPGRW